MLLAQYTETNGIGFGGLFDNLKVNVNSYKKMIDKFKNIESFNGFLDENNVVDWDKLSKAVGITDSKLRSYLETLDDGKGNINNTSASVEGMSEYLKKSGQMFNFAAIKATILNTALNAGIFLLASAAIQKIAKAFDNYIHRTEKARERTDALFSEFKQMNDALAGHRKTVSELAQRYDELSKGVSLSNNDNRSLSAAEYEEFLDINRQLVQSFPELAKGIDENGNSILTLGTNGITAREELAQLLQTEEDLNNFRIGQGLEDVFNGVYTYVEDANEAAGKLNDTVSVSSETMHKLQDIAENGIRLTGENNQFIFAGNVNNPAELAYRNALTASVSEFWKSLDGERRVALGVDPADLLTQNSNDDTGAFALYANLYRLTPEEITALENIIQDNVGDAGGALLDSVSEQKNLLQERIQKGENAWADFIPALVSGMKSKQTFQNLDSDLQDMAVKIVEGLDYGYADAMQAYDPDPYAYIRDKFIVPMGSLNDADKRKLQSGFEELLKLDADNLSQNNQAEIQKQIDAIASLLEKDPLEIRAVLGFDTQDLQNGYDKARREAKRQIGGYGHDDRGFETNNADGDKLDDFWDKNVITQEDWALWQKVTNGITDVTEAINAYTESKKNADAVKITNGPVTFDTESFSETLRALSSLQSVYQEFDNHVKDNTDFTFALSDIESLREAFGETCAEFENFEKLATSSATSAEELQQSFDALATQYVIASLDGLNESTREQIVSQLALQGIIGASELLTEELASAYGLLSDNGYTLADASNAAYWELLNEAEVSDITRGALYALSAAEIAYNSTGLDVQDKISQLGELAQAYGDTATAAISQAAADRVANGHGDYESVYADMMASANRAAQTSTLKLGPASANTSKGGGGSKSRQETAQEFDWAEKKLQNLQDDISRLDKAADSAYASITEKNQALAESIGKINEEIILRRQAYENYMAKANAVGLSDEYKDRVHNGALDIESITDENLKEAIKNYEQWYDKAKETQDKIDGLYVDAKDKHVEAYGLEAEELETLRESQAITEREYLDAMLALYEKYYAGQSDFANQAKEAKLEYLKEEKDYLETVADAAASLLDSQIDETEDDRDKARKNYEGQIAVIEDTIRTRELEIDAVQAKIDALRDEGDELDRQKNLLDAIRGRQEALFALERARNQRSRLLYKDGQMVWAADDSAIKEADKNVEDAQAAVDQAERDIRIADLQMQIDQIQNGIDALEGQKAKLEALADESDAFFDKKIADIQAYQNEWKQALAVEERSIAIENLKAMFGEDAVAQILAHNTSLLSVWKQACIDTMAAIDLVTNGSVGAVTKQWGELAGVSADMDHAMQLSGLSIEELTKKADMLGIVTEQTADSSKRIGEALSLTDTSSAMQQFYDTGNAAADAQNQINGITEKLNALASDVQNYTVPAINSQQFAASLGTGDGTGGILGDLSTFIERFREICASIPSIWNGAMSSMGGGSIANGEDVSYGYLLNPLVNAMDATKLEIDAKLKEYADAWTQFNTDLGDIIGIGSGGADAQTGGRGALTLSSSKNSDKQAGTDTIVGTIETGGEAAVSALDKTWIPGFEGFAAAIDRICSSICAMTEDMANDVIDMANKALKAMKEVEAKNTGAYKIGKVHSGYSPHTVSSAHVQGAAASAHGRGPVAKDQTSLVNELGNEILIRDGMLHEIPGGAHTVRLKRGDIILNHRQTEQLKKHGRVTADGGHGKLIGSFASGAGMLGDSIRAIQGSGELGKLLADVEKLRNGQSIVIDGNNTILKDKSGNPYREGTVITPKGDVYTPLPESHPAIQMQKAFAAYIGKMGPAAFSGASVMAQHTRQMENMVRQLTNLSVVTNHNNMQPVINMGGVTITCPGVTEQQVMKHVGIALEHEFTGLAMKAYQKSMISR